MDEGADSARVIAGRYVLHEPIAAGGMATVHFGRLLGASGFTRTVAIKRLLPEHTNDPARVEMLLREAKLAARIRHPNVNTTLDVVTDQGEFFLIMEYAHGESLARLIRRAAEEGERIDPNVLAAIFIGVLEGLHAAHEARSETSAPLGIVHRDISPANILVGADGIARVLDFGIAKATAVGAESYDGELKGKMAYMAPEQLEARPVDRRTDVYAVGVTLWESLTLKRLFRTDNLASLMTAILGGAIVPPSRNANDLARTMPGVAQHAYDAFDGITLRATARVPAERFPTAKAMADAIEASVPRAYPEEVAAFVARLAADALARRSAVIGRMESGFVEPEPRTRKADLGRTFVIGAAATAVAAAESVAAPTPRMAQDYGPSTVRVPNAPPAYGVPPPPRAPANVPAAAVASVGYGPVNLGATLPLAPSLRPNAMPARPYPAPDATTPNIASTMPQVDRQHVTISASIAPPVSSSRGAPSSPPRAPPAAPRTSAAVWTLVTLGIAIVFVLSATAGYLYVNRPAPPPAAAPAAS